MRAWIGKDIEIKPGFDESGHKVWHVWQHDQPAIEGNEGFPDYQDALAYAQDLHEAQ